jgi:RimJ/RimL family protein N-acetyltransferase
MMQRNIDNVDGGEGDFAQPHEIRKLIFSERIKIQEHFLRLNSDDRRRRFFGAVSDDSIAEYCSAISMVRGVTLGCFVDGTLRAVGELRRQGEWWDGLAEVAITVEEEFQGQGIGTELLRRLLEIATNRMIKTVNLFCQIDNLPMQKVARKLGASLHAVDGTIEADIEQRWPNGWSLLREALADGSAVFHAVWGHQAA